MDKKNSVFENYEADEDLNPHGISIFSLIYEDFIVHRKDPLSQGFWAVAVHRYGNWSKGIKSLILRKTFFIFYKLVNRFVEWTCGITILHSTKIGRRLHIWHHSGIIINAKTIGNDVVIRQNTTIGEKFNNSLLPVIGNNVDIGCGAVILGNILVGDNSSVGANSVVIFDVVENSVVAGVPARFIKAKN